MRGPAGGERGHRRSAYRLPPLTGCLQSWPGGKQGYVYFPTSAIVSLLYVLENGSSAEIAITGNEGLVGIALFMGSEARMMERLQRWEALESKALAASA